MKNNDKDDNENVNRLHRAKIIDKALIQPNLRRKINRLSEDEMETLLHIRRSMGTIDPLNIPPGVRVLFL